MIKCDDNGHVEINGSRLDLLTQALAVTETIAEEVPHYMILGPLLKGVFPHLSSDKTVALVMQIEDWVGVEHGS